MRPTACSRRLPERELLLPVMAEQLRSVLLSERAWPRVELRGTRARAEGRATLPNETRGEAAAVSFAFRLVYLPVQLPQGEIDRAAAQHLLPNMAQSMREQLQDQSGAVSSDSSRSERL